MLSRIVGKDRLHQIFVFLYAILAFGLPFNKVVLSLATLLLALFTILEFNKKSYSELIRASKLIQLFLVLLGIHILSIIWTSDYSYFFKDLNIKLPFYVLPLILLFHPLKSQKEYKIILYVFLASITLFSLINFISYYGWRKKPYDDIRALALFISHIRFGLMLVFGCVISVFWMIQKNAKLKWIAMILILWFLTYTYFSEVLSAYIALVLLLITGILIILFRSAQKKLVFGILFLTISIIGISIFYLVNQYQESHKIPKRSDLPIFTSENNKYEHNLSSNYFVNGNHIYSNICGVELMREWQKVSNVELFKKNKDGYEPYYILIQYMASKGLKKDAKGFSQLSPNDISKIEAGIANYKDNSEGLVARVYNVLQEFEGSDPNGKTILQRLEFWKAGLVLIQRNMFLGVGAGDLAIEFEKIYNEIDSKLYPENRLRAHNLYLTYFISFGIIGGLYFLFFNVYSLGYFYKKGNLLALMFLVIVLSSYISEDTIETQMGATFVGFFLGLFLTNKDRNILF